MAKKDKPIKPRGVWKLNPKTHIKPNKKKNIDKEICIHCNGQGTLPVWITPQVRMECSYCGGTGLI